MCLFTYQESIPISEPCEVWEGERPQRKYTTINVTANNVYEADSVCATLRQPLTEAHC